MEFGKVADPNTVDFTLPRDHAETTKLLASLKKKKKQPEIYIGCAKWGRPDWVGLIYPKKTKAVDFLKNYVTHFNSIELNAMFYQTFPRSVTEKWAALAGPNFKFAPKMPQVITHMKRLKNVEEPTEKYMESLEGFGDKLGHCFMQFDDRFGPNSVDALRSYLDYLPKDFKVCIELRHEDWFKDTAVVHEAFDMFRQHKVGTVMTDASGRRDVLHMHLSTPVAFVRFVSNNMHPTDYPRMDAWVARMKQWIDAGMERIYFFMHCPDEANSPILCKYVIDKLNAVAGLNIPGPTLLDNGPTLF